jgi:hypothetical protein
VFGDDDVSVLSLTNIQVHLIGLFLNKQGQN